MKKTSVFLLIIMLFQCNITLCTNYYINSISGNDSQDGRSEKKAWKSISKVNSHDFLPGDTICFKRGCIWRETLKIPSSGNNFLNLVFSNYGSGPKPKILGSVQVNAWMLQGLNVWKSSVAVLKDPYSGYFQSEIFLINTKDSVSWGRHKSSIAELTAGGDWTWSANSVFIYSASNPNTRYSCAEIPQRQQCIDLHNKEYIQISGIDLFFSRGSGISYDWSYDMMNLHNFILEKSEIAYIGSKYIQTGYGTEIAYSKMIFRQDTIHDCGRRGISLDIYGSGFVVKNVTIENCVFYSGYHTTGIDLSVGKGSYTAGYDSVIIRRNLFFDEPASGYTSNQIFLQNYDYSGGGATVKNVFIYSNIFKYPGFASIMAEGIQSCFIYNNTFYNHNISKSGDVCHIWIDANNLSINIKNNIFYSELTYDNRTNGSGLVSLTKAANIDSDYNLFFRINKVLGIIYYRSKFSGAQLPEVSKILGWESHSPMPSDPLFTDPLKNDFRLKKGSLAIGSGVHVTVADKDYEGNRFSGNPSLGAFEYQPADSLTLN